MIIYEIDKQDLKNLEKDFDQIPEKMVEATDDSLQDLVGFWRQAAKLAGAIETGNYMRSISSTFVSAREFLAQSGVGYSGFIELGVNERPDYPARYPALKALENFDQLDQLETNVTNRFDEIFEKG